MTDAVTDMACHFAIEGELTIYTAADIKARLMPFFEKCPALEIDLSHVSEMDTAGLQLLILAKREYQARNGHLRLIGHSQPVLEVLDLCNMGSYFGDPVVVLRA